LSIGGIIVGGEPIGGIPLGGEPGVGSPSVNGGCGDPDGAGLTELSLWPMTRMGVEPVPALGLEFVLPLKPLELPGLTGSGWVGSLSSVGAVDGGGLEALAIRAGSIPSANGRLNGPRWRTGGVWLGETGGGLVEPPPVAAIWSAGIPGEGRT
jgi:hypothetical protein